MQTRTTTSETLYVVQALRAWAAFSVVMFHVLDKSHTLFGSIPPELAFMKVVGPLGVDIFFVISGFIMMMTTHALPTNAASVRWFLWRRFIRIAPLYWLVTSAVLVLVLVAPNVFRELRFDARQVIASYLFVPVTNNMGNTSPLLGVGWTLNFEMYFYIIFAGVLLLRQRLLAIMAFFGASLLLGQWLQPTLPMAQLMTSPLLLQFVAGAAVACAVRRYRALPVWVGAVGLCWLVYVLRYSMVEQYYSLQIGAAVALMLAALVSLERTGQLRVPRWLVALGDSSYALYLSHVFVLAVVARVWMRFVGSEQVMAFCVIAPLLILPMGHMLYRCVERPMTRALQR
jgi:peptidoglycan/LPS O-acetylase OafA/YrhL